MQEISFRIHHSFNDRVNIAITGEGDVDFNDLMKFCNSQFPHLCGPIHYVKDGYEMGMVDGKMVPIKHVS